MLLSTALRRMHALMQGVEDFGTLCRVFSNIQEGMGLTLAGADGAPIAVHSPRQEQPQQPPASLLNVSMRPTRISAKEKAKKSFTLGTLSAAVQLLSPESGSESLFHLTACQPDAAVHCVLGADKMLSDAVLVLSPNTYIVFDETCSGVYVENIIVRGARTPSPLKSAPPTE